jgi:hypothetical protein
MRIGILTWARNTNYGGALQALALKTFLCQNGIEADLITYLPLQTSISYSQVLGFCGGSWRCRLLSFIRPIFICLFDGYVIQTVRRIWKTRRFLSNILGLNGRVYACKADLNSQTEYDVIIVGSDQVWNPWILHVDDGYLLNKMRESVIRIAYAPSVATYTLCDKDEYYKSALPKFKAVSVRENASRAKLAEYFGKPIEWVVDPSLLLTKTDWCLLLSLQKPRADGPLVIYWLSDLETVIPEIVDYANSRKRSVVIMVDVKSFSVQRMCYLQLKRHMSARRILKLCPYVEMRKSADAREFLALISQACAVVSNSFHGMVFSCIFGKCFKNVLDGSRKDMWSRLTDFCENISGDGFFTMDIKSALNTVESSPPKFDHDKLDSWISRSREWLLGAVKTND